jgi:hypothetical protein
MILHWIMKLLLDKSITCKRGYLLVLQLPDAELCEYYNFT